MQVKVGSRELFKHKLTFYAVQNFYLNELIDDLIDFINNNLTLRRPIQYTDKIINGVPMETFPCQQ